MFALGTGDCPALASVGKRGSELGLAIGVLAEAAADSQKSLLTGRGACRRPASIRVFFAGTRQQPQVLLRRLSSMVSERFPRKLVAILYADVAGYSRLTGQDEDGTHKLLSGYLDDLAATVIGNGGYTATISEISLRVPTTPVPVPNASSAPDVSRRHHRKCAVLTSDLGQKGALWHAENRLSASDPTSVPCLLRCSKSSSGTSSTTSSSLCSDSRCCIHRLKSQATAVIQTREFFRNCPPTM